MNLLVVLRPEAIQDILDTLEYFESLHPGLGQTFLDRLDEGLARIRAMPEMYGLVWRNVRAMRLRKFRYVVYYRVQPACVEVLAVLHGARDSSAWRSRA